MPHDTTPPAQGLHGSFAWSCATEGCAEDDASNCSGVPFIAGISDQGTHVYAECVADILTNPQVYADENLVLHGTHLLTDELLQETYGDDHGMPPADSTYYDRIGTFVDVDVDDNTEIVAVAIDTRTDSAIFLNVDVLLDILDNPNDYADYVLYGTHILPEHVLTELFGPVEEDPS